MWLTDVRGRSVQAADSSAIGALRDVVIALDKGDHHPVVSRLVAGTRRTPVTIDIDDIAGLGGDVVVLREEAPSPRAFEAHRLRDDELLLARDVLDTQVVDIAGHRLARVSDVLFSVHDDGRLHIDAVDVGFARVLRRMHLGVLATHADEELIDWAMIHLASPRGHDVTLAAPRTAVHRVDPRELAAILDHLDTASATEIIEEVESDRIAEAIIASHHATGERLLRSVTPSHSKRILDAMPEPHGEHWRARLGRRPALRGRRFHRLRGWRRHGRPPGSALH